MYVAQSIKKKRVPSPADLTKAFEAADSDDVKTRDVRPLMSILMRLASINPRLKGHILTRRTAVAAFGWKIVATDPADAEKALEAQTRLTLAINEIVQHQVQSVLYDVFLLELEWVLVGTSFVPTPRRRYKPVELEKESDYVVNILQDGEALVRGTRIDMAAPNDLFIVDISEDDERGGLMRSIVYHGILQYDMMIEWGNYNRKLKGILQALYDEGAADEEIAAAKSAMETASQQNFIVTSRAIEFKINEVVRGSGESFEKMIDKLQADISIGVLGQANTSELPNSGGSRAALQILNLVRTDIHNFDMIRTERIINEQLVTYDFRRNYDQAALAAPWKFEFIWPESSDLETRVAAITEAYNAGIPLDAEEAYSTMGLKRPESEVNDVLVKSQGGM